jgi:NhaA family Na+:H+ antiporter
MRTSIEGAPGSLVGNEDHVAHRPTDWTALGEGIRVPWSRSGRAFPRRVLQPLQAFLAAESAGGLVLLAASLLALSWANSPLRGSYEALWRTKLTVGPSPWVVSQDLRHWVNDGLMSLFFLVVGLEIKREVLTGELRTIRAAALPVVAAIGGMVAPALLYLGLNAGGVGGRGWGVPMATDIAFALGVLTLTAGRARGGLKPFLLTLAIVDDIGAIVVIAAVYSGSVSWTPLLVACALVGAAVILRRIHVRAGVVYLALGIALWVAVFESGVHASVAGVVLGLLTPAAPFQRPAAVSREARRVADRTVDDPWPPDADAPHWLSLAGIAREAVSPLARLEAALHPWTTFLVVPLFALANAGVRLSADALRASATSSVTLGIVLGLVAGKLVGVLGASALAVRMGVGALPEGVTWRQLAGGAAVAGIGFTLSIFVAELAFPSGVLLERARLGVLLASVVAGGLGYAILSGDRSAEREGP